MDRIATIPLQRIMTDGIQRSQSRLGETQQDLATGRRVHSYADLGSNAVRSISAHSMLSRHKAEMQVSKHVETTLGLYDTHLTNMDNQLTEMRTQMLTALGNEDGTGLQEVFEGAFERFRDSLNADEGGVYLFGGSSSEVEPFMPQDFQAAQWNPTANSFRSDGNRAKATIGENHTMTFGIGAREVGEKIYDAFRTLSQAAPFTDGELPWGNKTAIRAALEQLDEGLAVLRNVNGENGRKMAKLDAITEAAEKRSLVFERIISESEDADLGKVATDLAKHQASLQASYSVFARLSSLNLTNYL